MKNSIAAASVAIALLAAGACATTRTYQARSQWPKTPIKVDGMTDDWRGALAFVEDGDVSLGFHNDQNNLYICLLVANETTRNQIMRGGLTVWFDPKGGKEKTAGIRYPAGGRPGASPMDEPPPGEPDRDEGFERPSAPGEDAPPGGALDEIEILGSGDGAGRRVKLEEAGGVEVKVEPESGLLIYELKIPLAREAGAAVAIGVKPGATVGVGFETAKPRMGGRDFGGRGSGRGGMGGMPGGGGGRFGGGRGPGSFDLPKPIKIWTVLRLSSREAGAPAELASMEKGG